MKYLTPVERETQCNWNDLDDYATITTHRRSDITKLSKNRHARIIEEGFFGKTKWASYELPISCITFRNPAKLAKPRRGSE